MKNSTGRNTGRIALLFGTVVAIGLTGLIAVSANASLIDGSAIRAPMATLVVTPDPPTTTTTVTVAPTLEPAPASSTVVAPPPTLAPTQPGVTDDEIRSDVNRAFGVVNTYWTELFNTWEDPQGRPVHWDVPDLMHGDGFYDSMNGDPYSCDGDSDAFNAGFCAYSDGSGSGVVSWDMALFRYEGVMNGDAPAYAIVAHEVAHAAQARFWHDGEGLATPDPRIDLPAYEQQADCFAGATLAKAEEDGYFTVEPGDLEEIAAFFLELESGDGGDHGSSADRLAEFRWGYGGDVESCLYNQGVPPH